MPFTLAHPAIVLPLTYLAKRWYSLTGLVIGSITPDFEYFIRMKVRSNYSHTLKGLFYFDLPVGLLLCFVFHCIVRNPLYKNLPPVLSRRVVSFESVNWIERFKSRWFVILISLIVGAVSHLLWDGFTHSSGYFVQIIPTLENHIAVASFNVPIYKMLQHGSSLIGLCLVMFSIAKLPIKNEYRAIDYQYWLCVCVITIITIGIRLLIRPNHIVYSDVFVTIISGSILSIILTPCVLKNYRKTFLLFLTSHSKITPGKQG